MIFFISYSKIVLSTLRFHLCQFKKQRLDVFAFCLVLLHESLRIPFKQDVFFLQFLLHKFLFAQFLLLLTLQVRRPCLGLFDMIILQFDSLLSPACLSSSVSGESSFILGFEFARINFSLFPVCFLLLSLLLELCIVHSAHFFQLPPQFFVLGIQLCIAFCFSLTNLSCNSLILIFPQRLQIGHLSVNHALTDSLLLSHDFSFSLFSHSCLALLLLSKKLNPSLFLLLRLLIRDLLLLSKSLIIQYGFFRSFSLKLPSFLLPLLLLQDMSFNSLLNQLSFPAVLQLLGNISHTKVFELI
mmetsp:Transcript_28246/g.63952  ORF Transcript_28246/g.63952 Transcript_28246/m.63952 type:complete len:299 (+) Transcript_28246:18-914(+)